jgi:hypothetical protein
LILEVIRALVCLSLLAGDLAWTAPFSNLKRQQEVVFYPTLAHSAEAGGGWELEIHGCVYDFDQRRLALALLREALGLEGVALTPAENKLLTERARLFMVDHKAGKKLVVRIGGQTFTLSKSTANGQFSGTIRLSDSEAQALKTSATPIQAVLPANDPRQFIGALNLFADAGITVISDIDDTIKVTQVHDRKATLRNTFLNPFQPVPGMAEVYRAWAERPAAQFCYVSASPWQLFLPLSEFVRSNGFPAGMFYLKNFRLKDESVFSLFQNPEKYKPVVIEPLLKQFPQRQFVLVGDSGERDPEIYGRLARQYPGQVIRIFIRNVSGEPAGAPRYKNAFRDLPSALWKVFQDPSEIIGLLPQPN